MNQVSAIMAWEDGELEEGETVELFQELVDSGLAWSLQGCYGRMASRLIEAGRITAPQRRSDVFDGVSSQSGWRHTRSGATTGVGQKNVGGFDVDLLEGLRWDSEVTRETGNDCRY